MTRQSLVVLPALWIALGMAGPVRAQSTRKARPLPDNVLSGTVVTLDSAAALLTLKPRTGAEKTYRVTEKTLILRAKAPAQAVAFKPGEAVVVRFRKSSIGPPALYDLADKSSWEWLDRLRHETTRVTVREITETTLRAEEGSDAVRVEYRVTGKTRWSREGREAGAEVFGPGDRVCVAPRLLPGGGLMAIAVSDTPESAALLKERSRPTVTGTVKSFDPVKRVLSLHTTAGDERELRLAPDCLVRQASKDEPLTTVKPGRVVTAHLKQDAEGERIVTRLTLQMKRAAPSKPGSSAGKKP